LLDRLLDNSILNNLGIEVLLGQLEGNQSVGYTLIFKRLGSRVEVFHVFKRQENMLDDRGKLTSSLIDEGSQLKKLAVEREVF
jgi:hypothetical protein